MFWLEVDRGRTNVLDIFEPKVNMLWYLKVLITSSWNVATWMTSVKQKAGPYSHGMGRLDCHVCSAKVYTSVCLRLSKFSQLFFMQYMGLRLFSLPICLMMIVRIHVFHLIIIIKIGTMTHLPVFRVKSWSNGMRCMSFSILMNPAYFTGCTVCIDQSLRVRSYQKRRYTYT